MTHPVLATAAALTEALKSVADVNPTFMTTDDKAAALRELVRVESQVAELKMRVLAVADDVADGAAARDAAAWLAAQTRVRSEDARADLDLAVALDRRWVRLADALRQGHATTAQARVISRALDQLPEELTPEQLGRAEEVLVDHAAAFGPRQLTRIGEHLVDVIAPEIAEELEARRLAALESDAYRKTRLTLRRLGDGTTRLSSRLPDAVAARLATYLEAFTSPRKVTGGRVEGERLPYPRRLGEAFCQLLEAVDPHRLPLHAGDATTVIVTVDLDSLRAELGTAELVGASRLTAAEARRLACTARIIPAVLGGDSEVLDLGRSRRLHSAAQRKALLLRDRECRAEGCDIPGTWCEAHHWIPWAAGGSTNVADGVLLCAHHHHLVHDAVWSADRLANGDVRFARRT